MATPAAINQAVTIPFIGDTVPVYLADAENQLATAISGLGSAPSQTQLLKIQMQMQTWTLLLQFASTMQKEIGDALKGIVQKI